MTWQISHLIIFVVWQSQLTTLSIRLQTLFLVVSHHLRFNPFPSSDTQFLDSPSNWHLSPPTDLFDSQTLNGFLGSPSVTDTETGILGLRVPRIHFHGLLWPWLRLGIGWEQSLLDGVTKLCTMMNSGGHDTGWSVCYNNRSDQGYHGTHGTADVIHV